MNPRVIGGVVAAMALVIGAASAHVVVEPHDSIAGEVADYVVRIPSHLNATTVAVELEVPQGVEILSVAKTPGGSDVRRDARGIVIIRWTTKNPADERGAVSFTARNPGVATELIWKAHQFYDNGVKIDWIDSRGGKQIASVTRISDPGALRKAK